MAFVQTFVSARVTAPDLVSVQSSTRTTLGDPSVTVYASIGDGFLMTKDAAAWSPSDVVAAQTSLDTAPAATPQSLAQADIDRMPLALAAIALLLVDKLNDINGNLVVLLAAVNALNTKAALPQTTLPNPTPQATRQQAINAIRAKAGTL